MTRAFIYNPATDLLCAPLVLNWGYVTLRKPSSPVNARLALSAMVALSMLQFHHRQHDTRFLLLAIPACAMLWVEGGLIAWLALLFIGLTAVFTWDFNMRLLAVYFKGL